MSVPLALMQVHYYYTAERFYGTAAGPHSAQCRNFYYLTSDTVKQTFVSILLVHEKQLVVKTHFTVTASR